MDEALRPGKAAYILDQILEAQNQSYLLGLKLNLAQHDVEAIHTMYLEPKDRLLHVLIAFLKHVEPTPTWRVILDALRTPSVNLQELARRVERAHFPDSTPSPRQQISTCSSEAQIHYSNDAQLLDSCSSPALTTGSSCAHDSTAENLPQSVDSGPMCSHDIKDKIKKFEQRFNDIKNASRLCLEKCQIPVRHVANALTSLPADEVDEHKHFLESHVKVFYQACDHSELFGTLSFNWNYLSYQLLDHLIIVFQLEVRNEMEAYKADLKQFREETPLKLFCRTQKRRFVEPPSMFKEVVAKFDWPDDVTLEVVERFRQEYAYHYRLRECAMMLAEVRPGSFIISWYIPQSIAEYLKAKIPRPIFKSHFVTKLNIAGTCIYNKELGPTVLPLAITSNTVMSTKEGNESCLSCEMSVVFVEQPSGDFYCPVTYGLLLQPHLTSCCGKHISQEASTRIRRGACPLCNTASWSTVLNKHFQRQVNEMRVFCCHDDRGCDWQGELSELEHHVHSCPMREKPLKVDIQNFSVLKEETVITHSLQISNRNGHKAAVLPLGTLPCEKLTVECHNQRIVQQSDSMFRGSATTDLQFAYFAPGDSNSVYSYEWSTKKWKLLPQCPFSDSALVSIDGELTTVGGRDGHHYESSLFTLRQEQWIEKHPPMNTARSDAAVVSTSDGEYITVIGGYVKRDWTETCSVELLHMKERNWCMLTDLPKPLSCPSATICNNQIYVTGGGESGGNSGGGEDCGDGKDCEGDGDIGFSCRLEGLLPQTSQSTPQITEWTPLPRLPVTDSTTTTLSGQLVTLGGKPNMSPVNSIHQLVDGEWVDIGSMSSGRWKCLVVSQSQVKMMVVGGYGALNSLEEIVVL